MSKIIRTIVFVLVLAGLLGWGMSTLAQAPSVAIDGVAVELQGQALEGVPVSRDQIQPVGH